MKKKIIGFVTAAILLGGSLGYAASSSLVGAKVTGVFTVQQNGTKIADAVIINGSAYAPVRAISEATGTELTVEGKVIVMGKQPAAGDGSLTAVSERSYSESEKETMRTRLKNNEEIILKCRQVIEETKVEIAQLSDQAEIKGKQDYISDLESRIAAAEVIIYDIKERLGE